MLAITYSMKKEIKVAKWGTPKKYNKKTLSRFLLIRFFIPNHFLGSPQSVLSSPNSYYNYFMLNNFEKLFILAKCVFAKNLKYDK
jgi:hypothetical protein